MVDLRVARAINSQTDADPSAAGTARHAAAAQLAASAMAGLFGASVPPRPLDPPHYRPPPPRARADDTFLERMLEEAKGVEEGEEEGEEESEA